MTDLLRGALGLLVLMAIGIALSENRRAIQPPVVVSALAPQVTIGVLMLFVQRGRMLLEAAAVTTIFLGQSEMPVALRRFAEKLEGPELFAVMTGGMAAVAGSTLAGYAGLGVRIDYLLAASLMAVPGGLLFAKLMCPSTEGVAAGCRPVDLPSARRARDRRVIDFVE